MLAGESATLQKFLDENQYSNNGVLRYEHVFGRGFVSTGGRQTTESFLRTLDIKPNADVLDIGCGIGGSAFLLDLLYGATVRGVDLSQNMISLARERREEFGSKKTTFYVEDVTKAEYEENSFDLIYSRDAIIHIAGKTDLYRQMYKWLKPGGCVFVTEYGNGVYPTKDYLAYIKQRDYHLLSVEEYRQVVESVGFEDVEVCDLKEEFSSVLKREVKELEDGKDEFVKKFTEKDYDELIAGWTEKIGRVEEGSQTWISIYGRKPSLISNCS